MSLNMHKYKSVNNKSELTTKQLAQLRKIENRFGLNESDKYRKRDK